jgi:predicted short-subunit dehydrogenase-like oxidoreductase (DUF2520 family)
MLRVVVVGAGRMGQGIALALSRSSTPVALLSRTPKPVVSPLTATGLPWTAAIRDAELVLLATPDGVLEEVAERLAGDGGIGPGHVVLHLSGLRDRRALAALGATGAGLGSFHPLQTVAEPATAPERLRGAYAGIEGDARAMEAGERLALLIGMIPVRLPAETKAAYHAGATLVANYTVVLVGVAERLAREAGVPAELAARIYLPLLEGATANLRSLPPARALTGAVRRGDTATVLAHLAALRPVDRILYAMLGREALLLAREAGLAGERAAEVERVLDEAITGPRPSLPGAG